MRGCKLIVENMHSSAKNLHKEKIVVPGRKE
jgi:hypothetical protein